MAAHIAVNSARVACCARWPDFQCGARLRLPQRLLGMLALARNGLTNVGEGFLARRALEIARLPFGGRPQLRAAPIAIGGDPLQQRLDLGVENARRSPRAGHLGLLFARLRPRLAHADTPSARRTSSSMSGGSCWLPQIRDHQHERLLGQQRGIELRRREAPRRTAP